MQHRVQGTTERVAEDGDMKSPLQEPAGSRRYEERERSKLGRYKALGKTLDATLGTLGTGLAVDGVLCYSVFAFVALVSPFVLKRRKVRLAAFLFPARFTAVSSESAKDARFPSKVAPERVHQIAFI